MKPKTLLTTTVLVALGVTLAGCTTIEENKGAAVGAGLGAAAGILIGESTGGRIVGGLIGALVGGAVGHYVYDKPRTREETAKTYNYQPSQGTIVTIENVEARPQTVQRGGVVDLTATYALLTPSEGMQVSITEIRQITHNGEPVGNPQVTVERTGGTYTSTIPLRLPDDAGEGVYVVKTTIEGPTAKDTRESTFSVE